MTPHLLHFLLITGILLPFCSTLGPERQLVDDLLKGYGSFPKSGRPVEDPGQPLEVSLGGELNQIILIDQQMEYMDIVCTTTLSWMDSQLKWNSDNRQNISQISINVDQIWTPDVFLVNGIKPMTSLHPEYATVSSDGKVTWSSMKRFLTSCPAKPGDDTQICKLSFIPVSHNRRNLDLTLSYDRMSVLNFVLSNDWEVLSAKGKIGSFTYECCPDDIIPAAVFSINVKARPKPEEKETKVKDSKGHFVTFNLCILIMSSTALVLRSLL